MILVYFICLRVDKKSILTDIKNKLVANSVINIFGQRRLQVEMNCSLVLKQFYDGLPKHLNQETEVWFDSIPDQPEAKHISTTFHLKVNPDINQKYIVDVVRENAMFTLLITTSLGDMEVVNFPVDTMDENQFNELFQILYTFINAQISNHKRTIYF